MGWLTPEEAKAVLTRHGKPVAAFIKSLVPSLREPVFFWLDAHWYPDPHAAINSYVANDKLAIHLR